MTPYFEIGDRVAGRGGVGTVVKVGKSTLTLRDGDQEFTAGITSDMTRRVLPQYRALELLDSAKRSLAWIDDVTRCEEQEGLRRAEKICAKAVSALSDVQKFIDRERGRPERERAWREAQDKSNATSLILDVE